jgi:beta-1,2-mannobiose phosphorylase / 1,2-beta-oligomannan phosphorylase
MSKPIFTRHPENPIVVPGEFPWREAVTFNPGVIRDDDGRFYLYERTAGQLRPFHCFIGLRDSDDGVHFSPVGTEPVFTPEMAGSIHGSVQDPRVVKIDGVYYMTYAFRPFAWSSHPTGVGVPESHESDFPGVVRAEPLTASGSANVQGARPDNMTRSGIALSTDRVHWQHHVWATPADIDDRDVILFPEKVGGRFALLRRPLQWIGAEYGTEYPGIWLTFSDDLQAWDKPLLLARSEFAWEGNRIGAASPPLLTDAGWLMFYHGVETLDASVKRVCYRLGAMLLERDNPAKVLARTAEPIMEPETYYERFGLYIPNVIFPTANVVVDDLIYLYYGVCDTAIALATVPLDELLKQLLNIPTK